MVYGVNQQLSARPRAVARTVRRDAKRVITSSDAGLFVPVAHIPLMREDSVRRGRMRVNCVMGETADRLLNGVSMKVEAHFVPKLAFKRFRGLESFNRSYFGEPEDPDDPTSVIHFYETKDYNTDIETVLGVHKATGSNNTDIIEAYNVLVNWQRKQRSKSLPQRGYLAGTLARCFWNNTQLSEVVPSFDSQQVHGDVALNVVATRLDVSTGETDTESQFTSTDAQNRLYAASTANQAEVNRVFAEMSENGVTVSLSNLDLARQTQAFAQIRNRYQSIDEEYLVDALMDGLRIPDAELSEPILLAQRSTLFGFNQRYATDFANLDKSMTEGQSFIDLDFRMPANSTGGIILITASVVPEQLYERQLDHAAYITDVADLPSNLVDSLDPEKIEIMTNGEVDTSHTAPSDVFGYRPLNAGWMRDAPNIGGKFFRPDPTAAWDEDRNRFWATETVDPSLTEDFYLCTTLPKDIFSDANVDSLELSAQGLVEIMGLTVFGSALREATDDYEAIMAKIDQTRIEQPDTAPAVEVLEDDPGSQSGSDPEASSSGGTKSQTETDTSSES